MQESSFKIRPEEVTELAKTLRQASPVAVLKTALKRFPSQRIALSFSGTEDVVLIDMLSKLRMPEAEKAINIFCLDTGRLHAATYRFIDTVQETYNLPIHRLLPEADAVEQLVRAKGLFSFYEDGHQECCGIRKVAPLKRHLATMDACAWFTGQRRDQSQTRSALEVVEVDPLLSGGDAIRIKLNPLALWTLTDVWDYIRGESVPYNPLHDQGYVSIGCAPCTRPPRPGEHERAGRWWWEEETRRECGLHVREISD